LMRKNDWCLVMLRLQYKTHWRETACVYGAITRGDNTKLIIHHSAGVILETYLKKVFVFIWRISDKFCSFIIFDTSK
jgi:hypothetical protein